MLTTRDLPHHLRHSTETAHRDAERALGLPGTVASLSDYASLLARLLAFHRVVEAALARPQWADDWTSVGVVLGDHDRSALICDDLERLDTGPAGSAAETAETGSDLTLGSFGEALGLLYVVEGSALGGRYIGPTIRQTLGDVPTRFYDSDGRDHPGPWRALQAALRAYEEAGRDSETVIRGAEMASATVRSQLSSSLWSASR